MKMEIRNSIFFLFFICLVVVIKAAKIHEANGYVFTSQRTLKIGSNNQLQFLRFGNQDAGSAKVSLFYKKSYGSNETLASENTFKLPKGKKQTFFELFVSPFKSDNVYGGRIQIDGTIGEETFSGSDDISFGTPKTNVVVIQTDKPLYKPGQNVLWRILKLSSKLKPSHQSADVGEVYIEDPKGTRLFQQKGVYLGKGLTQSEFLLADEPLLGTWKITVKTKNETESTTFDVKEYQLPKFEVKITFPPYTLATAKSIPITVCANFTYGKPVTGTLNLNVSIDQYFYYYSSYSNANPIDQKSFKLDGCYTYDVNVTAIQKDPKNPNYYSRIKAVANVVQEGTGVQINDTEYLQRTTTPLSLDFDSEDNQKNYFKPGLPYNGQLKVTNPDSTPAAGETIQLSYIVNKQRVIAGYLGTRQVQYSKNFTSDAKGIIKYTIPPQNEDVTSVSIDAQSFKYSGDSVLNNPSTNLYLSPFYSPSGSYIQLASVDETIPCDTKKQFKLLFTSKSKANYEFYYEVLKNGQIYQSDKKNVSFTKNDDVSYRFNNDNRLINDKEQTLVPSSQQSYSSSSSSSSSSEEDGCPAARESRYVPPVGEAKIEIDVDYNLCEYFTLLVFYVRDDKEIVADSQSFKVEKCFQNKVNFKFGDAVKQPGQNTSIHLTAAPNSLCGIRAIDKSVTLLDNSNQLNKDKIIQLLNDMNVNNFYTDDPCNEDNPHQPGLEVNDILLPPGRDSSSSTDDTYAVFQQSGFVVISNLRLFTRKCNNNNFNPGRPVPFFARAGGPGGSAEYEDEEYETAEYESSEEDSEEDSGVSTVSAVAVRNQFPDTWLFEMELVGPTGSFTTQKTLPDTITEWIGDALCLSSEKGLGFSDTTSIRGFQLFFISYTLPISAIRGEEFTVVVSIYSYAKGALPVTVSLDDPQGYEVDSGSINKDICIQPGTSKNFPIKLKATTVGNINITVRAETAKNSDACGSSDVSSSYARDAITQSLEVEAEGFPVQAIESILFCPLNLSNQTYNETYRLALPDDVVNDSQRAFVDVTGNILGPAIRNLDNLVSLPTGCGEQNLVKFVPNYLVLDYLSAIGELKDNIKAKAIQNLNIGYQRELTYRHNDGSYSAFGPIDGNGSMFLTAFVARSFSEAKRYITIDDSVITSAQKWIADKQQKDGCFPDIGKIIDTGLQGGIEKDNSPTTITAYVLTSLRISQYKNQTVIDKAVQCLEDNPPRTPYEIFLDAYGEALAGATEQAQKRIKDAKPLAQTDEGGAETYFNPNGTDALDLETVAYAVLTNIVLKNDLNSYLPLVRDLTQNLKPNGGFYSTQDTCIGLSALSGFAKLVYGKPINIDVKISGALDENVKITDDNKLLVQRNQVTNVPGDLDINAKGSGCGLIQLTFRYNSISPPNENKFYIKVLGQCSGKDCAQRKISGTVRYLPDGKAAGFSIVAIKMITGIVPDMDGIKKLPGSKDNNILRADVEDNRVILYFNEITNNGENFEFPVNQVIKVDNPQPGSATVTNYYNPEISSTTTYEFDDTKKTTAATANKKDQ